MLIQHCYTLTVADDGLVRRKAIMTRSDKHPSRSRPAWPERSALARVGEETLSAWFRAGTVRRFDRGEELIAEGDRSRNVFLLLSGCVKVAKASSETLLAIRAGGDIVGELAALDGEPRSATVTTCGRDPVVACDVSGPDFVAVLARNPRAFAIITASITAKFRAATRRRAESSTRSDVRLAEVLVELVDNYGHPVSADAYVVGVDLTQAELGALIGVSGSTAFRAVRVWRENGWVETDGRRMIVRDIAGLREFAGPHPTQEDERGDVNPRPTR